MSFQNKGSLQKGLTSEKPASCKKNSYKCSLDSFLEGGAMSLASTKTNQFSDLYRVEKMIGKGNFGKIFKISSKRDPEQNYAAKMIPISNFKTDKETDLEREALILRTVSKEFGFPSFEEHIVEDDCEIMVMSLLGPNLSSLHKQCGFKFSLNTTLMIGIQTIKRLEALHRHGFLHRDIKPENFAIGSKERDIGTIYLLDFGLSSKYVDENDKHVSFSKKCHVAGTLYYLSVFGHLGIQASRRDDLISLGYMLIHLCKGELPWIDLPGDLNEKVKKIFQMKSTINIEKLCEGLPKEFCEYFNYVTGLPFFKKPDYEFLQGLFTKMLKKIGADEDQMFDWNKTEQKGIDLNARKIMQKSLMNYKKELESDNFVSSEI